MASNLAMARKKCANEGTHAKSDRLQREKDEIWIEHSLDIRIAPELIRVRHRTEIRFYLNSNSFFVTTSKAPVTTSVALVTMISGAMPEFVAQQIRL